VPFGLAFAQQCAVKPDGVHRGSNQSEQDAYEGEDNASIEAIVEPMADEISQDDTYRESNAELRGHGKGLNSRY
jgi:hypothetical protein